MFSLKFRLNDHLQKNKQIMTKSLSVYTYTARQSKRHKTFDNKSSERLNIKNINVWKSTCSHNLGIKTEQLVQWQLSTGPGGGHFALIAVAARHECLALGPAVRTRTAALILAKATRIASRITIMTIPSKFRDYVDIQDLKVASKFHVTINVPQCVASDFWALGPWGGAGHTYILWFHWCTNGFWDGQIYRVR